MTDKFHKICIIATVPYALNFFMLPHIKELSKKYCVTIITNGTDVDFPNLLDYQIKYINIPIERKVSLYKDVVSWLILYKIIKREHFSIVHSLMPKTALVAMTAAYVARTPKRIHTFTGQVWVTKTYFLRFLLKSCDRLVSLCASDLLVDSASQRDFLIAQRIVAKRKIKVIANGSVCGVDMQRFRPNLNERKATRIALEIPATAVVFLFLGRVGIEKGIMDLVDAFSNVAANNRCAYLVIAGPDEGDLSHEISKRLAVCSSQYRRIGFTDSPEKYMSAADVFCLPSYREGFGSVLVEAAAVGLPTIASNIYGIVDAMVDEVTGVLHPPKSVFEIQSAMQRLLEDEMLRKSMGNAGLERVKRYFSSDKVIGFMRDYYSDLLLDVYKNEI